MACWLYSVAFSNVCICPVWWAFDLRLGRRWKGLTFLSYLFSRMGCIGQEGAILWHGSVRCLQLIFCSSSLKTRFIIETCFGFECWEWAEITYMLDSFFYVKRRSFIDRAESHFVVLTSMKTNENAVHYGIGQRWSNRVSSSWAMTWRWDKIKKSCWQ